ncbi:MAG: hypothetical protein V7L29_15765 [Nostoc sp.]|uniref:hypothetical protein n=1 Tax=Nostoc sp. TaxID=1180 RepID=UPI002FF4B191
MKIPKALITLAICVLSVTILYAVNISKVEAQPTTDCRKLVTGTYLTTNSGNFGTFRGILTLSQDGNFFASASNQSRDALVPPYGHIQGSWKCTSSREITVTTLDFIYPTATSPGAIGRTDTTATFEPKNGIVQATSKVRSFDLNANPLVDNGMVLGTFTFTGQRVKPGQ